jgi:hypothetical protein
MKTVCCYMSSLGTFYTLTLFLAATQPPRAQPQLRSLCGPLGNASCLLFGLNHLCRGTPTTLACCGPRTSSCRCCA